MESHIEKMYQYIYGNWHTMVTYVYAELGIADLLHQHPQTVDQLAAATQIGPQVLKRLLRCAAALGFHVQDKETGRLGLTELGALLSSRSPSSLRAAARLNGAPYRYGPWGQLLQYLYSGTGRGISPCWEIGTLGYLQDKPELLAVFEQAMTDLSKKTHAAVDENRVIAENVDFSSFTRILDMGSGNGDLLQAILSVHDSVQGTLMDLHCVLEDIDLPYAEQNRDSRLTKQEGNFYESIPPGYDAYIMKNVIHNHPENRVLQILQNVHQAMSLDVTGGNPCEDKRLILFEMVMPDDNEVNAISSFVDLNLNLLVGGTVRSREEYREILSQCGFELLNICTLPNLQRSVIWARIVD